MSSELKIFVLGANGFLGSAICDYFLDIGQSFIPVTRNGVSKYSPNGLSLPDFEGSILDVNGEHTVIVNAIGSAHKDQRTVRANPQVFYEANERIVERLAKIALKAKVKRFIQISSIGVLGKNCRALISQDSLPQPVEPYALSKHRAELILKRIFSENLKELVIVRPTMVYGVEAKGNFARLKRLVATNLPLPLRGLKNRKGFISDKNLASFLYTLCLSTNVSQVVYNVSDLETLTMEKFIMELVEQSNSKSMVFYMPKAVLKFLMIILGKSDTYSKLTEDFQVDMRNVLIETKWKPVETQRQALKRVLGKADV